ncbi:MAG: ABC transporter permease [Planctomycetes bacterium]|nr:ABC transporter permease [Planctomycetota bacterium]NOG53994.1 ABC transporter permease [Planctomycetota bacterium]
MALTHPYATADRTTWQIVGIPLNPLEPFTALWRHRSLIRGLVKREIQSQHKGTLLGIVWLVVQPLMLLTVYTFVFATAFRPHVVDEDASKATYALMVFTGLILYTVFAETIGRAPRLMSSNKTFIKQIIFPIEILPAVVIGAALVKAVVSFVLLIAAYFIFIGVPTVTAITILLVVPPLLFLTTGLAWFISSLSVFIRDCAPAITVLVRLLLFLCPVFYSIEAIGYPYRYLILANPVSTCVILSKQALFKDQWPSPTHVAIYWVVSLFVLWFGYAWFTKTRKAFADVM